jgi:uncharacterized protein with PIN domain
MPITPTFIADVHLGKLARLLRLLGMDTIYNNAYNKKALLDLALIDNRILLSKDGTFAKHPDVSFFQISSQEPMMQLRQVADHFPFNHEKLRPFSRCLRCNGILHVVLKQDITANLLLNTQTWYHDFWQCSHCRQVYWKGSHYERMLEMIRPFLNQNDAAGL